MRFISKLMAPVAFILANTLFRSSVLRNSKKKHVFVMKVFRFAADNGHVKALSIYGHLLHFRGEGVQNRIQGGIYIEQAALKGEAKAQYQIAKIYESGFEHYFAKNEQKALMFYQKAAEQAHALAVQKMVDIYKNGQLGVTLSQELSQQWEKKRPSLNL